MPVPSLNTHHTQTHYTLHKHTTPHLESESASDSELDGGHSLTQSSYAAPGVLRMRCLCLRAFNACLMPHSSAGLCTQLQKCSERAGLCVAEEQGHSTLHKHRNLNNGVCATIRCRDAQLLVRELLSCREVHDPCEKRVHPRKMVCATCTHSRGVTPLGHIAQAVVLCHHERYGFKSEWLLLSHDLLSVPTILCWCQERRVREMPAVLALSPPSHADDVCERSCSLARSRRSDCGVRRLRH